MSAHLQHEVDLWRARHLLAEERVKSLQRVRDENVQMREDIDQLLQQVERLMDALNEVTKDTHESKKT